MPATQNSICVGQLVALLTFVGDFMMNLIGFVPIFAKFNVIYDFLNV